MTFRNRKFALFISGIVLFFAIVPFAIAYFSAGPELVFSGALLNPLDGGTYFAKAYQGWLGEWRFRLPYTAEAGHGAYINLFYLFIGHVSRWTGLSIDFVYHAARLTGAALMLWALQRFIGRLLSDGFQQNLAFALAALGLGLGWLAIPFGVVTADFWVAEAYPLLAALTNPHFPLGLALILWLAAPRKAEDDGGFFKAAGVSLLLGLVSPFGVLIALLPWAGVLAADLADRLRSKSLDFGELIRQPHFRFAAGIVLGGAPVLLYDLLAIRADPQLAAWDAQNLTQTPPWWDLLISLSPAVLLAVWGLRQAPISLRSWLLLGLLLIFIPFGLQRRFMLGLSIPTAVAAAIGLDRLGIAIGRKKLLTWLLALLVLPGTLLLLATAVFGALSDNPMVFMTRYEYRALEWIEAETPADALVLASPEMGLFIPARTGRRVIYGHPLETVEAAAREEEVIAYFRDDGVDAQRAYLADNGVDFVFFGSREISLGARSPDPGLGLVEVFSDGDVVIYKVQK